MNEYLSKDQQKQMQSQALMSVAMSLLKNSGYTTQPISLGQALGSAYEAGTAGYQGAQKNAIQQMLTKQKLDEYKRQVADDEAYKNMFTQMPVAGAAMTPTQALSMPGMSAGPTQERAAMIGAPTPAGVSAAGGMPVLTPVQMDILRRMPAKEGRAELLKLSQPPKTTGSAFKGADGKYYIQTETGGAIPAPVTPADMGAEEFSAPVPQVVNGQTQLVQYNKYGTSRVVPGATPYEPSPAEVKLLREANMPITMENIMAIRQSSATKVDVRQNAAKSGVELAYDNAIKDLAISRDMARSANTTLANIDRILPALDTAIVGPAADTRTMFLRIGKQLNIAGANADEVLKNTAVVVQGLAQQELAAAEQMRGQGTLTDSERAILRRAAGGDQSLTAGELRVGLLAAQRTSRMRAQSHSQLLRTAVTAIPELSTIAPMYEVQPYGAQAPNPLQNAIQQELDRRRSQGGRR
jgi:hypothetical protein